MKHQYRLLAAALSIMFASGALAEDAVLDEVEVKAQAEKNKALQLSKQTSTANRVGLTVQETPASIEILDTDTIRRRGDISLREAVSRTTGLTDISTPNVGQAFSLRGLTGNNSVGQAEDGVRQTPGLGTSNYPADTWGYEQIEVLRGPASVMFGDGTSGGIINSVRKQPKRETSAEAVIGAGSYGAYRAGIGGTGAIGEIGAFRIDVSTLGGNSYISKGDYESTKLMTSLLFTPTDSLKVGFTLDYSDNSPSANYGVPVINGKLLKSLRNKNYNVSNNKLNFIDTRFRNKIEWDITSTLKLKNEAYWFKSKRDWRNAEELTYDTGTGLVDRFSLAINHDQKQYGNRLELISTSDIFDHQNRFAAGIELSRTTFRRSNGNVNSASVPLLGFTAGQLQYTSPITPDFDSELTQRIFFVEDAFSVTDRWKLIAGIRKELLDTERQLLRTSNEIEKDFSPTTWRVGTVFDVTPDTSLYVQVSRGTDPVSTLLELNVLTSDMKLTRSRQAEVGIKHKLPDTKGEVSVALFHIAKDDIITYTGLFQAVQGGKLSSRGIELTTTLFPTPNWRVDFNATALNARYDDLADVFGTSMRGNTPPNVPEHTANAWVSYQQPQWDAGIGARYVGKRYVYGDFNRDDDIQLGSYTVFDASAAWHVNKQMTLRANIRNLTDKFYGAFAYSATQQIVGAPRQIELTAEFRY
ncbi:TonB-dependent receptor [Methylobacillus arboreus]|uniref:TonB-dependent receptor n=1 Tax=Methylobacillus arboreus TaxID=755170 RepID=UPI001E2EA272|nr:TonB-dependent receptor [Methylobacillus arboreus]MCB5191493.1 TonB-dependent receptor [Methylobacillus arboreus]